MSKPGRSLLAGAIMKAAPGIAMTGNRLGCLYSSIAGIMDAINDVQQNGFTIESVATYTVEFAGIALECGAKVKAAKRTKSCGEKGLLRRVIALAGQVAPNIRYLMRNSFEEGTLVYSKTGYRPIEDISIGDEVAEIDEKTGKLPWRKVTGRYSRAASGILDITVTDGEGKTTTIKTTPEHPFHVEDWDGKVETLLADLQGTAAVPVRRQDAVRRLGERGGAEGWRQGVCAFQQYGTAIPLIRGQWFR
jgi:Pretoxin HINT domain